MSSKSAPASRQSPRTHDELSAVLGDAVQGGASVRFRGGGSKFHWGAAVADCDVEISTLGLDRIVEHNEGDLTAVVEGGATFASMQETFASAGQMLALDPPLGDDGSATIGGIVATADSGPLRHRYGSVRDLVVGMTVALSDGTVAKSGGKVIKNVAGYDLAKLFAGAYGTLGAILQVAVRLHPLPPHTATAVGVSDDAAALAAAVRELTHARLELQSMELVWQDGRGAVMARLGGATVADPSAEVAGLLGRHRLESRVDEDDQALWDGARRAQRSREGIVVRVSGVQDQTATLLERARELDARLVTRAAFGLSWITVADGDAVEALRGALSPSPCVVLDAPAAGREALDVWGPQDPGAIALMKRVRERFDPAGACAPGLLGGLA
ncbi:MAG: FAD-binding oxidoreductase [Thermoleophilaceae bacterium]